MRRIFTFICSMLLLGGGVNVSAQTEPGEFAFKDGDRVVFLGDTWVEREQQDGYIEARLTSHLQGKKVIFRNLAWSADTVLGESRAGFDAPEKGFDRLKEQLQAVKPTVVFLGYGMAESFQGEAGVAKFRADMVKLMETIEEISKPERVRFVVLSPLKHQNLGAPLPDPSAHNEQLKLYVAALKDLAREKNARFVDLYEWMEQNEKIPNAERITDNGIHPSPYGFWRMALGIERSLGWGKTRPQLGIRSNGEVRQGSSAVEVSNLKKEADRISFDGAEKMTVVAEPPSRPGETNQGVGMLMQFAGLKPGKYTLRVNGKVAAIHDAQQWAGGAMVHHGPAFTRAEELRLAIVKKNALFFYRWRPQNQTYLFGFRKHEQGQNAKEIPMFDPLITAEEEKIQKLAELQTRHFELAPTADEDEQQLAAVPAKVEPKLKEVFDATPLPHPTFDLGEGLEVTLWAENPNLAKPIQINFDPQGRLWVASSEVYPQIQPGQVANDKILILEDTDKDGKADKTTIFADGLLIPTGVIPGDGGAYVANSTELLHYRDVDHDGKADDKRVMLSGFGTEDTHHILHTLRWGHDGQLYMNQSIYIHSHVETPHGVVRLDSGGIWNFRPGTWEAGIHAKGLINPWGHHFDRFGQSFATDGAGNNGINWVIPQAMFVTYEGARRLLDSVSPGNYPKFCGLEVIESEAFPEDWQGTMVTCDFRAHRVVRFGISEQGAGYVTKELPDLMRSTNVTFRPIDVKVGPDGAIYIADWSNPIIQHGEVDFRDPRRDHEHGRIWRVAHKAGKKVRPQNLLMATDRELLQNLDSPNGFTRQESRRVLTERGSKILPELERWTGEQKSARGLLEALWMYQSIDVVNSDLLGKVLEAEDGRIRAAATRVLSFWHGRLPGALELVEKRIQDEHPRVRVEAVRAVAKIPGARSAALALGALELPMDRFLDYAIWLSINDLAGDWVAAIQNGDWKVGGREKQLAFGLKAIEPQLASRVLDKVLPAEFAKDGQGPWFDLLVSSGSGGQLNRLFQQALRGGFNDDAQVRALRALSEAMRVRQAGPSQDRGRVVEMFDAQNAEARALALRLAGQWKVAKAIPEVIKVAGDDKQSPEIRRAAFQSLRDQGGPEVVASLDKLAAEPNPLAVRIEAARTLAGVDLGKAIARAVDVLPAIENEEQALQFWRALLANKGAAAQLAQALPKSGLPAPAVKAGLRAAREGGRNEPNLVLALARNSDMEGETKSLSPEELKALLGFIREKGDPARGELIYRRQELGCVSCHAIGGVGGKVGPDMTSIGASAQLDYLVESVQFPNRKVKEGYHSVVLETADDEEISGILVRETDDQLFVRDTSNREVSVPKKNIKKRAIGGSLMPAGLVDGLNEQQQADLYRFLSELGKPGQYDASKGNVARTWRLMGRTIDLAQFPDEKVVSGNTSDWPQSMTLVDGRLPKAELQAALKRIEWRNPDAVFAIATFEAPADGTVNLELGGLQKAAVWVDGKLVETRSSIPVKLSSGRHTLAVKMDANALPEFLRVSTPDATFVNN